MKKVFIGIILMLSGCVLFEDTKPLTVCEKNKADNKLVTFSPTFEVTDMYDNHVRYVDISIRIYQELCGDDGIVIVNNLFGMTDSSGYTRTNTYDFLLNNYMQCITVEASAVCCGFSGKTKTSYYYDDLSTDSIFNPIIRIIIK